MNITRFLAILVLFLGIVAIVFGGVFIGQGIAKNNELKEAMQAEAVLLPLHPEEDIDPGIIDNAEEAQAAGDIIREHRRGIAPTYQELLGEGRYDPTNPQHLSYAQALNMENYLYLAVVGFGLTQAVTASGAFMLITGFALWGTWLALYQLNRQLS